MPGEYEARSSERCASCGGRAVWNPQKQALLCPYCGTEARGEEDAEKGEVKEIELAAVLRELEEKKRGWQAEKRSVKCESCQAISVFDPERVAQNCEFCGSPSLVPYEELESPLRPQSLLPFQVSEAKVRETIREWYATKWLAPGSFSSRALLERVKGVYLPYWTFDAEVRCDWEAEAGTYYYRRETYRDAQGRRQVRQVRQVQWRNASGRVKHYFNDELVPASRGIHEQLLRSIEPFPTQELMPYEAKYVAGFIVEHYQVALVEAARQAREAMRRQLERMCAGEVPGDTYRNLRIYPRYSGETFKHILVPVWLVSYQYGRKAYQVVVNGYTGKMEGEYPKSVWKIVLMVLAALVVVFVLAWLGTQEG